MRILSEAALIIFDRKKNIALTHLQINYFLTVHFLKDNRAKPLNRHGLLF
jgi:hypothetical protein